MKNKWLLCILLMLFLPFGLFAQVAPPLEKQKTETQEAPENNNEVTTNSDTTTDGDAGKTIKGVINDEQGDNTKINLYNGLKIYSRVVLPV